MSYFASGPKGDKGERGQADDTRTEIERLEANLEQLQENMTRQMGERFSNGYLQIAIARC